MIAASASSSLILQGNNRKPDIGRTLPGVSKPFDMRRVIGEKAFHPEEGVESTVGSLEYHAIVAIFGFANPFERSAFARDKFTDRKYPPLCTVL